MNNTFRPWVMSALGCGMLLLACCMHAHSALAQPTQLNGEATQPGVVNLNTASADELERLPRIGPARAQAILALRAQLTHFTKVEQLLRVKGIGRATFRKLRPLLTLTGPTTLLERRPAS